MSLAKFVTLRRLVLNLIDSFMTVRLTSCFLSARPLPSDTKSLLNESKSPSYLFTVENVLIFHGSYHFHLEI